MEDHEQSMNQEPVSDNKKNNTFKIVAIVLAVLIAGLGVFFYFQNEKVKAERAQREAELNKAYEQLDSISTELNNKILTISQLGGEIDTLIQVRDRLEQEKKELRNEGIRKNKKIYTLQEKVDGYQELLLAQDKEIDRLKEITEQLMVENTELKTEKEELSQSLQNLNQDKEKLESKIKTASQLKAEGVKIFAVNRRGKEREYDFRNRHIEKLKIEFYIAENKVAPIEGKEVMIRILDPLKKVLFDVTTGSGTFKFKGREMFYTASKEILYDRSRQKVTFYYTQNSDYADGEHTVEIYTDDYLMGSGEFFIK
ncbi:MAG TPA: chromosome segregation protein SMC [Cyclobacteriaceae bacterium]